MMEILELKPRKISMCDTENVVGTIQTGQARLLLSDNPETLNDKTFSETNGTLWHDEVKTVSGIVRHRIFGWHVNETGRQIKIGVTIENLSARALYVQNVKHIFNTTNKSNKYITDVGQYISKLALANKYAAVYAPDKEIVQGGGLVDEFLVKDGFLVGFLCEFEVLAQNASYFVRVVASKDTRCDLRKITHAPLPNDGLHYRGSWEKADLLCQTAVYHVGRKRAFSISNGETDNLQNAERSYDTQNATHNPGHYGANYHLAIPIKNESNKNRCILVGAVPRGGVYAGAVKNRLATYAIPLLDPYENNFTSIMSYVAPPGNSLLELTFMHAGACNTPLAVYLSS